jgi:hypothetical protein
MLTSSVGDGYGPALCQVECAEMSSREIFNAKAAKGRRERQGFSLEKFLGELFFSWRPWR